MAAPVTIYLLENTSIAQWRIIPSGDRQYFLQLRHITKSGYVSWETLMIAETPELAASFLYARETGWPAWDNVPHQKAVSDLANWVTAIVDL